MKKSTVSVLIVVAILSMLLAACGTSTKATTAVEAPKKPVYAFVSKTTADPMFTKMFTGFQEACAEFGVECIYKGTDNASAEKQIEILNQMIAQNVAGIAVIGADFDALTPILKEAMGKGIPVVSTDSAVNPAGRNVHIEFVDTKTLGRLMMESAYKIAGGEGQVGILNGDARVAFFADVEKAIFAEYNSNPAKYGKIEILPVQYGFDLPDQSTTEAQAMLKNYPNIKVIICPTTVAILSAGKIIQDQKLNVKITGVGLPSEMANFIKEGICPEMYLWSPMDMGYLTAQTLHAIVTKLITGKVGDKFNAGRMGPYEVTLYPNDGGTQVLLGDPTKFDINNIDQYSKLF